MVHLELNASGVPYRREVIVEGRLFFGVHEMKDKQQDLAGRALGTWSGNPNPPAVTVRLRPEIIARLRALHEEEGLPLTQIVRLAIHRYVKGIEATQS